MFPVSQWACGRHLPSCLGCLLDLSTSLELSFRSVDGFFPLVHCHGSHSILVCVFFFFPGNSFPDSWPTLKYRLRCPKQRNEERQSYTICWSHRVRLCCDGGGENFLDEGAARPAVAATAWRSRTMASPEQSSSRRTGSPGFGDRCSQPYYLWISP